MKYAFILAYFALALATASANIVSYLRFEEGSGFGAFDETGLMNGEVLDFSSVLAGGGTLDMKVGVLVYPPRPFPLPGQPIRVLCVLLVGVNLLT